MLSFDELNETFACQRCGGRGAVVRGRYTTLEAIEKCPTCRGYGYMRPVRRTPAPRRLVGR